MDGMNQQQWPIKTGDDVLGADGQKVGSVVAVEPNYIVVEKGFFFPTDYYIPMNAIAGYNSGTAQLNVTRDQALKQNWQQAPTEAQNLAAPTAPVGNISAQPSEMVAPETMQQAATTETQPFEHVTRGETGHLHEGQTIRIPIEEEELIATTTPEQIGEVEINKDVVTQERTIDVPVTEERVRVERRAVEGNVPVTDENAFKEGTIDVPVYGEKVNLEKVARQTGEVDVTKEKVQRTEEFKGNVRREEVNVKETGNVELTGPEGNLSNPNQQPPTAQ